MKLRRESLFTSTAPLFLPRDWLVQAVKNGKVRIAGKYRLLALGLLVLLLATIPAQAGPFTLEIVAQRGDVIDGITLTNLGGVYSLNNSGTVAFRGSFSAGNEAGIFTQSNLLVETGDVIGGKTFTNFNHELSLNDNGTVAFRGLFSGGHGLFTPTELLVATGDIIGGQLLIGVEFPSLNNDGTVAYIGKSAGGGGIFTQNDLVAFGDTIGGITLADIGPPSINDFGQIAFDAVFVDSDGIRTEGIVLATPIAAPEFSGISYGIPNFGWIFSLGGSLLGMVVIRRRRSRG